MSSRQLRSREFENARGEFVTGVGSLGRKHENAKKRKGMNCDYTLGQDQATGIIYRYVRRKGSRLGEGEGER